MTDGSYTVPRPGSGLVRSFRVHVPTGYDARTGSPLIMIFHGWGGNEDEFLGDKTVTALADQRGYILVAPRGLGSGAPDSSNNSWSFSGSTSGLDGDGVNAAVHGDSAAICDAAKTPDYSYPSCRTAMRNTCSWTHCQDDDVEFAVALVEHISARLCVDTERVFATGGSNGGMLTWELGQNPASAPTFRAIAPVIGLPHRAYLNAQGKREKMPVLLITGLLDTTFPRAPGMILRTPPLRTTVIATSTRVPRPLPGSGARRTAASAPATPYPSTMAGRRRIAALTVLATPAGQAGPCDPAGRTCSTAAHAWATTTACPGRGR